MRCPACDEPNPPEAVRCKECGERLPRKRRPAEDDEGIANAPRRRAAEVERPRRRRAAEVEDEDEDEEYERRRRRRVRRRDEDGDEVVSTIIPYKNPKALASYYLGIFSLIPIIGLLLAIVAIALGILGFRDRNRNPRIKGTAHAIVGVSLGVFSLIAHLAVLIVLIVLVRRS
ncbi:MAG: zinc ribbon domain-containing protein [Planctomycetota bacterium]|nr:MAG: zinc ribbon domain-containing protein [Planctomycetota bacterium]